MGVGRERLVDCLLVCELEGPGGIRVSMSDLESSSTKIDILSSLLNLESSSANADTELPLHVEPEATEVAEVEQEMASSTVK